MKLTTELFIQRAKEVHGDRYDYSRAVYQRSTKKVEIICPTHGSFFQRPENHVNQKQRCPKCSNARKGPQEHVSIEWLMKRPERAYAPALLYVVEVQNKLANYLEVGVTTKSLKHNEQTKTGTTLLFLRYMSLKEALFLEEKIEKTLCEFAQDKDQFSAGKIRRLHNQPAVRASLEQILA